jgi:hypothetical protein
MMTDSQKFIETFDDLLERDLQRSAAGVFMDALEIKLWYEDPDPGDRGRSAIIREYTPGMMADDDRLFAELRDFFEHISHKMMDADVPNVRHVILRECARVIRERTGTGYAAKVICEALGDEHGEMISGYMTGNEMSWIVRPKLTASV